MSERKYSLSEIDRMRAALRRKFEPFMVFPQFPSNTIISGNFMEGHDKRCKDFLVQAEDELRTCMIGGVDPEELEATYPKGERK